MVVVVVVVVVIIPLFLRVVLAIRPNLETPLGEKSLFLWVSHSGCFWASFLVASHDLVLFPMPLFREFGFWMYWFKLPVILFPHSPTLTPISPFLRFDRTKQFPPWKNPHSLWMELWFIIQVASQLRIDSIIWIFFIDQGKTLAKPFLIFTTSTA